MPNETWLSGPDPTRLRCPRCGVWRPIMLQPRDASYPLGTRVCTCGFRSVVVETETPEALSAAYAMVPSVLAGPNDALAVRPNAELSAVCLELTTRAHRARCELSVDFDGVQITASHRIWDPPGLLRATERKLHCKEGRKHAVNGRVVLVVQNERFEVVQGADLASVCQVLCRLASALDRAAETVFNGKYLAATSSDSAPQLYAEVRGLFASETHAGPPVKAAATPPVAPLPSLLEPERDLPKPLPRVGWCRHLEHAVSLDGREFVCLTHACGGRFVPGGFDKGLTARQAIDQTVLGWVAWRALKGRRIIHGPDNIQAACDWRPRPPTTTLRYEPLINDMRTDPTLFLIAICGEGGEPLGLRLVSPVNAEARPPEGGWGWNKIVHVTTKLLQTGWTYNTDNYQVIDPDASPGAATFEALAQNIAKAHLDPTVRRRRPLVLSTIFAVEGNYVDLPRDVFELAYEKPEAEAVAEMRRGRAYEADLVTRARKIINDYKASASDLLATTLPAKETEPYRFKCWVEKLTEMVRRRPITKPTTLARFILSKIGWREDVADLAGPCGIRPANSNRIPTGLWRAIWHINPPTSAQRAAGLLRGIGLHSEADLILAVEAALSKRGRS